ncbi:MAG: baseplate J/gp47 family protein [Cloacibacillus sp.]
MAFNRPTLPELKERIQVDLTSRLELTGGIMRRSVVGVLSTVFAGCAHLMHGHLDWASKQLFVTTAEGYYLEFMHAGVYGILRKPAAASSGIVTFTGSLGSMVPSGSILKRASDGALFETTTDGLTAVGVVSQNTGSVYNCDSGAKLSLISPVSGVKNDAIVSSDGLVGGVDAETDDSLRQRVLQAIQNPAMGGARHDYVRWAMEHPGVTRAWTKDNWLGVGTVGVTFVRDNDISFIPDAGEVTSLQAYIDLKRPVTADVTVFAPIAKNVDFTLTISPYTAAVQADVLDELAAFFVREAEPGRTIYLSRVSEAISSALNEVHHTITAPSADVACTANEIATLGTVTFSGY